MPRYLDIELDENGDLLINDDGDVNWLTGADAVAQHLRCRFRMFKGEWFLNTDEGIPYFDEILEKGVSDGRIAEIFRKVIAETPGIVSVTSVTTERDRVARSIAVAFEAVTDEGVNIRSTDYGPFEVRI